MAGGSHLFREKTGQKGGEGEVVIDIYLNPES